MNTLNKRYGKIDSRKLKFLKLFRTNNKEQLLDLRFISPFGLNPFFGCGGGAGLIPSFTITYKIKKRTLGEILRNKNKPKTKKLKGVHYEYVKPT